MKKKKNQGFKVLLLINCVLKALDVCSFICFTWEDLESIPTLVDCHYFSTYFWLVIKYKMCVMYCDASKDYFFAEAQIYKYSVN